MAELALPQQPSAQTQPISDHFSEEERNLTSWFFLRLQNIYGSKYSSQWPDEISVKLAKREFCREICKFSRDELHQKFQALKTVVATSEEYAWPSIPKILDLSPLGCSINPRTGRPMLEQGKALPVLPVDSKEGAKRAKALREELFA